MVFEIYTYDPCLAAIKLLTFRHLPYPPCAFEGADIDREIREEFKTLTGYGTSSMESGTLFPRSSTGERLVLSRPRKISKKSWPSASNATEVQAFHDEVLSRSSTPASASRRPSRVLTPPCVMPEPATPFTPSCPSLSSSPSTCGSTMSILDTPLTGYHAPNHRNTESPSHSPSRLPLPTNKIVPGLHRPPSPTPGGNKPAGALLTTLIPMNSASKPRKPLLSKSDMFLSVGRQAPITIVRGDDDMDHRLDVNVNIRDGSTSLLPIAKRKANEGYPSTPPSVKPPGRIPRFVGSPVRRLHV